MILEFREIDDLTPSDFEIFVRDVFVAAGWSDAVITQINKEFRHGDGGVDIFAYKNKRKYAIEVKQRKISSLVDMAALNQLVTGARLAGVGQMILVTNSYFTSEVKIRALRLGVELVDRDELKTLWFKRQSEIGRDIKPRVYQETVIEESVTKFNQGKKRLLIEMATGLGKTYTVAHIVKKILQTNTKRKRVLFLAHQIEILLQSVTAFKNVFGIGTYSFSACFSGADPEDTDFIFASFDTFYTKLPSIPKNLFDIIIVDEAHHTPARTYSEIVLHFDSLLLIGLTATPYRMDNKDVLKFFGGTEGHIGKYDLAWALKHNKLAFPKYMVLLDDLDQTRISQLEQGLTIQDLDKRLFLHKKDEEVVEIIEKTIDDKKIQNVKGIIFCRSIKQINHLIYFFSPGSATLVHSKMTDEERRRNIRNFREGDYKYILVCDLFNEGVDIPETNLLVFMRYTGSQTIWLQQLGRGLRKTPNKDYVHVLDFVGSLERLYEVRKLSEDIRKIPIDKNNWDKPPKEVPNEIIHDATLEVSYNQSAARVLELIEELKYRLNSRSELIDKIRVFVDYNKNVPEKHMVEEVLENVACDQISTHFDSYWRYLQIAVPEYCDFSEAKSKISAFVSSYSDKYNEIPSLRAIAINFKYKSLLEFTESDIDGLINVSGFSIEPEQTIDSFTSSKELDQRETIVLLQEKLVLKYLPTVFSSKDIQNLDIQDRQEIKELFKSDFYFLKILKDYRLSHG
jgi:superfamily II DNA or RNA helicase